MRNRFTNNCFSITVTAIQHVGTLKCKPRESDIAIVVPRQRCEHGWVFSQSIFTRDVGTRKNRFRQSDASRSQHVSRFTLKRYFETQPRESRRLSRAVSAGKKPLDSRTRNGNGRLFRFCDGVRREHFGSVPAAARRVHK